jgi:hypothetical protein
MPVVGVNRDRLFKALGRTYSKQPGVQQVPTTGSTCLIVLLPVNCSRRGVRRSLL